MALPVKRLGIGLFSSPHLLLWCKRPSLRSAGTEGCGFRWPVAVQTTTRAAAQARGIFIRKMRPFEESHIFVSHNDAVMEQPYGVINTMPRPLRWTCFTDCLTKNRPLTYGNRKCHGAMGHQHNFRIIRCHLITYADGLFRRRCVKNA